MNKFYLFGLFFLPYILFAQDATEPFKDSDLIIVESDLKPVDALKKVALLMQEQGYFIQKYDPELLSLVVNKTSSDYDGILYRIQVYIIDKPVTQLRFCGDYQSGSKDGNIFGVAQYQTGILKGLNHDIFTEMNKVAKNLPGTRLFYSKL